MTIQGRAGNHGADGKPGHHSFLRNKWLRPHCPTFPALPGQLPLSLTQTPYRIQRKRTSSWPAPVFTICQHLFIYFAYGLMRVNLLLSMCVCIRHVCTHMYVRCVCRAQSTTCIDSFIPPIAWVLGLTLSLLGLAASVFTH